VTGGKRAAGPLTARGLKGMLTRGGVDHSDLQVGDDPAVWEDVETGERGTSVVVSGPKEARRQASHVLYDHGLSCAPYPDRDMWSRPGGGVREAEEPGATVTDISGRRLAAREAEPGDLPDSKLLAAADYVGMVAAELEALEAGKARVAKAGQAEAADREAGQ
jgi:hypothetical protein